ncbi:MAG: hypothetical protein DRI40_07630 [Chloroflexi bacterium]|nr:MAG: hypothetical protein DRI40_07630 [Chloroflexota bacterium]
MGELRDEIYEMAIDEVINGDSPEHTAREIVYALEDFIRDNVRRGDKSVWIQSLIKLASELGSVIPRREV